MISTTIICRLIVFIVVVYNNAFDIFLFPLLKIIFLYLITMRRLMAFSLNEVFSLFVLFSPGGDGDTMLQIAVRGEVLLPVGIDG